MTWRPSKRPWPPSRPMPRRPRCSVTGATRTAARTRRSHTGDGPRSWIRPTRWCGAILASARTTMITIRRRPARRTSVPERRTRRRPAAVRKRSAAEAHWRSRRFSAPPARGAARPADRARRLGGGVCPSAGYRRPPGEALAVLQELAVPALGGRRRPGAAGLGAHPALPGGGCACSRVTRLQPSTMRGPPWRRRSRWARPAIPWRTRPSCCWSWATALEGGQRSGRGGSMLAGGGGGAR